MKKFLVFLFVGFLIFSAAFSAVNVRITGWPGNPVEEGIIMGIVDDFNNSQTEITAEWQPLPGDYRQMMITQFSAGTAPDLFYVDVSYFEEFAKQNMMQPLDLYLRKDGFDIEDFYTTLVDSFTYNNRLYGLAKDFSTLGLYYNKKIFDEYGVEYPESDDTWFDLLHKCELLKAKGFETPLVLAADLNRLLPFIYGTGGNIVKEDLSCNLDNSDTILGLKFYVDLVAKYGVAQEPANVGAGWIGEAFGKENVAIAMSGPWTYGFVKEQYPEVYGNMGIVEMPHLNKKSTMIYTVSWSINRNSKNKDAAWEVLKYLTDEGQKKFVEGAGVLASRKSIASEDTDPVKKAFYDSVVYGTAWKVATPSGIFSRANDQINSRLKDLFYGKVTLEEAVKEIMDNYDSWVK